MNGREKIEVEYLLGVPEENMEKVYQKPKLRTQSKNEIQT